MEFETQPQSNSKAKIIILLLAILFLSTIWKAGLLPALKGSHITTAAKSVYNPADSESLSCVGPDGSLLCDSTGSYVAASDGSEFVAGNEGNAVWATSDRATDLTPPAVSGISFEDQSPFDAMFAFNNSSPSAFANVPGSSTASGGFQGGGFSGAGYFGGYPYAGAAGSTNGSNNRKDSIVKVSIEGSDDPAPTPEPSSLVLLVGGLIGVTGITRRK